MKFLLIAECASRGIFTISLVLRKFQRLLSSASHMESMAGNRLTISIHQGLEERCTEILSSAVLIFPKMAPSALVLTSRQYAGNSQDCLTQIKFYNAQLSNNFTANFELGKQFFFFLNQFIEIPGKFSTSISTNFTLPLS